MGDTFNAFIDNLNQAFWRLFDLPLFVLLFAFLILYFLVWKIYLKIQKNRKKTTSKKKLALIVLVFFMASFALTADYKITKSLKEIRLAESNQLFLNNAAIDSSQIKLERAQKIQQIIQDIKGSPDWYKHIKEKAKERNQSLEETLKKDALYILEQEEKRRIRRTKVLNAEDFTIEEKLKHLFGELQLKKQNINPAINYYTLKLEKPLTHSHIAVVDLTNPKIKIKITPEKKEKYLTSLFAKENNCILAINGEAGESPKQGVAFGRWVGNWVVEGKAIMLKDNEKRPFLAFDKENKAIYYPEKIIDTNLNAQKYNTIWGRFDILVNGQNLNKENNFRQPRTAMGINADATKLYLMVVDGRTPGHSLGMGLERLASILQVFGASDAMSCDQGGSSCMYLQNLGGIVNRPADDGKERFTYTHFGISFLK